MFGKIFSKNNNQKKPYIRVLLHTTKGWKFIWAIYFINLAIILFEALYLAIKRDFLFFGEVIEENGEFILKGYLTNLAISYFILIVGTILLIVRVKKEAKRGQVSS